MMGSCMFYYPKSEPKTTEENKVKENQKPIPPEVGYIFIGKNFNAGSSQKADPKIQETPKEISESDSETTPFLSINKEQPKKVNANNSKKKK